MKHRTRWSIVFLYAVPAFAQQQDTTSPRPVTVRDAIEMWKLADPRYFLGGSPRGREATFSPDGSRFIVVLRRGEVGSNTNRYAMLLWNTAEALGGTASPRTVLEMSSLSNREAINSRSLVWSGDNETVTFLGERPGEVQQVFTLNTRTGALTRLTNHPTSVRAFSRDASGIRLAYAAQQAFEHLWDDGSRRHGIVVSSQFLPDLIVGRKGYRFRGREEEAALFLQDSSGVRRMELGANVGRSPGVWLSPNGKYIVVATQVPSAELPDAWHEYHDSFVQLLLAIENAQGRGYSGESAFERYEIVDTRSGRTRVLLNAPIARHLAPPTPIVWSPNGGSLIVSGVFLSLDVTDSVERRLRAQGAAAVEVDLVSGALVRIGDRCLQALRWDGRTNDLTCLSVPGPDSASGAALVRYQKTGGAWRQVSGTVPNRRDPEIVLREGMNTPPKIYLKAPDQQGEVLLWDLNPQFRDLRFGKVEEVSWEWTKGQRISAGLYYPPDYQPGRRYPLVIQTHHWDPQRFWIDGPWTTSYAAQPLAARGIAVLQVLDQYIPERYGTDGQLKEVEKAIAIYRSAIEFLRRRGLIDARRVGIIGFSHTCFYVKYALAHAPSLFAAASVAEGEDGSYMGFMTGGNRYVDDKSLYGGPPVGRHLREWLRRSPSFNLDRVRAPLRITTLNPRFVLNEWEWFEGLRLLKKPVELVMLEDGLHVLQKPWERMISQEGSVDWFAFWLQGYEDPDPAKREQYARWHQLRRQLETVAASPSPAIGAAPPPP